MTRHIATGESVPDVQQNARSGGTAYRWRVDMAGVLHLLAAEPTLLPAAPGNTTASQMDFRRTDEVHECLICGSRADAAFVAATSIGPRWLDLCFPHAQEVRNAVT
jgi:hypothetical protein